MLLALILPPYGVGQRVHSDGKRKIVTQVEPVYPPMAKTIRLSGIVRLSATVAPGGKVVRTEVIGGSPLLVQSAITAVAKFVWEPRQEETKETIEINFRFGEE